MTEASSSWTVERLDALPADTMIRDTDSGLERFVRDEDHGGWAGVGSSITYSSAELLDAYPSGFRVVSPPIEALLSDETIRAYANRLAGETHRLVLYGEADIALRAAIAHAIGEPL